MCNFCSAGLGCIRELAPATHCLIKNFISILCLDKEALGKTTICIRCNGRFRRCGKHGPCHESWFSEVEEIVDPETEKKTGEFKKGEDCSGCLTGCTTRICNSLADLCGKIGCKKSDEASLPAPEPVQQGAQGIVIPPAVEEQTPEPTAPTEATLNQKPEKEPTAARQLRRLNKHHKKNKKNKGQASQYPSDF